ncbi:MAG TPA: hypothetical protein DDZ89_04120 [Clostridiales bacterium]|nr:hypothetical protein [Clostridiales bacterium]
MSDNEKKMIKKILLGDEKSFEQLFDMYHNKVYRICLGFMKNQEDAKDVAQEVFIKIYRKLDGFNFECSLATWIYTICASTCLDTIRKNQKIVSEELNEAALDCQSPTPEGILLLEELEAFISGEINKNTDKTAKVMTRRIFAQEPFNKISEEEKIPASSARTYFTRGRRKLVKSVRDFLAKP